MDLIMTHHALVRALQRDISPDDMRFVVRYGAVVERRPNRRTHYLSACEAYRLKNVSARALDAAEVAVVVGERGNVVTAFRVDEESARRRWRLFIP